MATGADFMKRDWYLEVSWLERIGYVPGRSGRAPLHTGMWLMNSEPSYMHTRALVLQRCIVVDSSALPRLRTEMNRPHSVMACMQMIPSMQNEFAAA